MTVAIEQEIAERFLLPGSAARASALIQSHKRSHRARWKLINVMIDTNNFKPQVWRAIDSSPSAAEAMRMMGLRSDDLLYAISEGEADQQQHRAGVLLEDILYSGMATLMYHESGVGFLESEWIDRYLLGDPIPKSPLQMRRNG